LRIKDNPRSMENVIMHTTEQTSAQNQNYLDFLADDLGVRFSQKPF